MSQPHNYDQVVYLLQGGGALGAYQVGVCEGLIAHDCAPDWVIGTSIGSINAAILAGNTPENRITKLKTFWELIATPMGLFEQNKELRAWENSLAIQSALFFGQPHFFEPKFLNAWETDSFYDTAELKVTLEQVIDFNLINQKHIRLTMGAVCVEDGELVYFDNTRQEILPEHIMASGALPPGFPAILIDGKHYWDGGLSSNTPLDVVFDEKVTGKLLCFMVNLFANQEEAPKSIPEALKRKKDIIYESRYRQLLHNFCVEHRLRHALRELSQNNVEIQKYLEKAKIALGQPCRINIVRFQYQDEPYETWAKDFEFSSLSLNERHQKGLRHVQKAFEIPSWLGPVPKEEGLWMHEF